MHLHSHAKWGQDMVEEDKRLSSMAQDSLSVLLLNLLLLLFQLYLLRLAPPILSLGLHPPID
jgi:hypothetical protein